MWIGKSRDLAFDKPPLLELSFVKNQRRSRDQKQRYFCSVRIVIVITRHKND